MTKTKYLLYAFKCKKNSKEVESISDESVIMNPWEKWDLNDIQKIITQNGVCINYLKSTDNDFIQKYEDLKLLELYSYLVENFDISKSFGFNTVIKWHKEVFSSIYPFAGELWKNKSYYMRYHFGKKRFSNDRIKTKKRG